MKTLLPLLLSALLSVSTLASDDFAKADILQIAENSSCRNSDWGKNGGTREKASAGYIKGMALSFTRSLCRLSAGEKKAKLMAQKCGPDSSSDALAWYKSDFKAKKMSVNSTGLETLKSLYTLGIGLGMRESSGKYCEGYDVTAAQTSSVEAEAGLFQFSYNSMGASKELKNLYAEYRADPSKCYLDIYSKGVSCKTQGIIGQGAGADFQRFTKSCPSFAAEYAMASLRVLRKHYGPINRKEAVLSTSCKKMLDDIGNYIKDGPASVCDEFAFEEIDMPSTR